MQYEQMKNEFEKQGIKILEEDLGTCKECGYCYKNVIILNKNLNKVQKKCVLVEELGHFYTTVGDINDIKDIRNLKQEVIARRWGYKKLIPLSALEKAYSLGLKYDYEIAEELGVTEEFLIKSIEYYRCKGVQI